MRVLRKQNAVSIVLAIGLLGTTSIIVWMMVHYRVPDSLWSRLRKRQEANVPKVKLSDFYVDALPRPRLAFPETITDPKGVLAWQETAQKKLSELLKPTLTREVPEVRSTHTDEVDGVTRELLVIQSFDGVEIPAFLLRKASNAPRAGLLVIPGHSSGIRATSGYLPDYQHSDALALAEAGYVVLTMEIRGMGYLNHMGKSPNTMMLDTHSSFCLMRGTTALGETVSDLTIGFNYLASRDDVMGDRIGVVGFSSGGLAAIYFAALDERPRVIVASGCVMSQDSSVRFSRHDHYGVLPDQSNWLEMSDCLGLLSPRPLLVHWGEKDTDQEGRCAAFNPTALPTFEAARRIYEADGAASNIEKFISPGLGHEFDNAPAIEFLARRLPARGK